MEIIIAVISLALGVALDELVRYIRIQSIRKKVYNWLKANTSIDGYIFRSTSAIATGINISEARVSEACYSFKKKIRRNKKPGIESWTIFLDTNSDESVMINEIW